MTKRDVTETDHISLTGDMVKRASTCVNCSWFKLRWKDGSGNCWKIQQGRHADEPICEAYQPRVVWVDKREVKA